MFSSPASTWSDSINDLPYSMRSSASSEARRSLQKVFNLAKDGNLFESEALIWTNERDAPRIPSPVAHDGILYALKSTSGILSAIDVQSGEALYKATRLEGVSDVWASPIVADGRLYIAGRDGTIEVVAAGAEFATLAVNHLDAIFDASPAVAGDELFLRGRSELYCIAESE